MDIESDESERWEDFFGSSTDLSPSLLGYYDNLSNKFISSQTSSDYKSKSPTPNDHNSKPSSPNKICNIRLLSPTVQRMMFHSGTMKDEQIKKKSSGRSTDSSIHSVSNSKFYVNTACKTSTPVKSSASSGKKINLPLSKLTQQLSLSSNDLLNDENGCSDEFKTKLDDCVEVSENNHSFLYDHLHSRTSSSVLETSFDNIDNNNNNNINNCVNSSEHDPENDSLSSNNSFLKKQLASSQNLNHTDTEEDDLNDDDDERYHDCNDASNYYVNIPDDLPKSLIVEAKNSSLHEKYEVDGRVSVTISRDSENNINSNNSSSSSSNINNNHNNNNVNNRGNTSIEKSKSKALHITESNPLRDNSNEYINSNMNNNNNNSNSSLIIINNNLLKAKSSDISDLQTKQHRPLSATSITSTTSTSSSSSSENHLASKHAVSYLASVESLADHSESELAVNNIHNLTVTEKLVLEIVQTEKSYVEDLRQIIHGYLKDWKERACLKEEELRILFSNITEIYDFSTVLLKELINSGTDPDQIAQCFIQQKDKFDVYTTYCTSYLEAISLLTSLAKASHTNALLVSTQKLLKHRLGLGSYLLKPVQRILKYHLLLENLRKHNDTENIRTAHELMREVANHIDQVKKSLEQQSRVKELSGILDGWLGPELTVLGELRHEGILMESNKPRIVLLFATMLIITKRKEDGRLQCKTYIHHKNLMLIEHIPGEPTSFNVIPFSEPRSLIKLTAKNRDSKRLWAQLIKQVMLEHFDIPNRAKELVFKLGDEEERASDKNTWKWGHSSTPEYLERRNQYRRSEMRYRSKKARKNLIQSTKSLDDSFIKSKSASTQSLVNSSNELNLIGGSISSNINCIHTTEHHDHINHHDHHPDCNCQIVKTELTNTLKSSRSKSETRVPLNFYKIHTLNRSNVSTPQSAAPIDSTDDLYEVKMYNKKNIPKRIEKIKKSRSKSLKENSKFYMELKITESSDNIPNEVNNEIEENTSHNKSTYHDEQDGPQVDNSLNKNDTQIITELLKENKNFDRLLSSSGQSKKSQKPKKISEHPAADKKPQLNTSLDKNNSSCSSSSGNISNTPILDTNTELVKKQAELILKLNEIEMDLNSRKPEPIYESLKRNVHVPYKYCPSPNLQRSKSQPYPNTQAIKVKKIERPDSDYVTLDFNAVINYNQNLTINNSNSAPIPNIASGSDVDLMKLRSSDSNINYNSKLGKLHERRISDVTELCRQSVIYKQGSEHLGSRIAHLDYADPKTLLPSAQCNILINKNSLKSNQERDSVVSLTSSNDSVNNNGSNTISLASHQNDSYYEDKIEELLENNNVRDSAIYSDDNNDKKYIVAKSKSLTTGNHLSTPPPLPAKPNKLLSKYDRSISEGGVLKRNSNTEIKSNNNNSSNSNNNDNDIGGDKNKSSWVLQQIKNFNSCK